MPSFAVTLLPSQHQFNASSKQNLLSAGLTSGLNLRYGCEGGNCGECLARLVEGDLEILRHSDFLLTPEQKAEGYFLSCCCAARSDCRVEVEEIGSVNEIPQQFIRARVFKIQHLSNDVISIALKTPRSQPLSFFAGQSITVHLQNSLKRNKSIASCPCDGLKPEIHVRYRENDAFSEYIFKQLKKNDSVDIQGPQGEFVLDDDSSRPLVFIAYDTGFSSIKSLLEHAIALEKEQLIQLYWIVTPNNTPYMDNYCRSIAYALDNFSYTPIAIREPSIECITEVTKRILKQEPAIKHSDVFMTIPEQYREIIQLQFIAAGIDDRHWSIDTLIRL